MSEIIIQEKVLEMNAKIFISKLPFLTRVNGLKCHEYDPLVYNGNYDDDGKRVYGSEPSRITKHVVFNYFNLGQYGDIVFDPLSDTTKYIATPKDKRLVHNSKIVVFHGSSYYEYRVDNFKSFRGKDGYILTQNILIPIL